jgi:hypothetical protein
MNKQGSKLILANSTISSGFHRLSKNNSLSKERLYSQDKRDFNQFRTLLKALLSNQKMKQLVLDEIKLQTGGLNNVYNPGATITNPGATALINNIYRYRNETPEIKKNTTISRKIVSHTQKTINSSIDVSEGLRNNMARHSVTGITGSQGASLTKYSPVKRDVIKLRLTKPVSSMCLLTDTNEVTENVRNTVAVTHKRSIQIPTLNLEDILKTDFNSDFLEHEDKFSPSWRDACQKIK